MTRTMSYDYSYLELNAIQRPFDYNKNRRLSWDDFNIFYQNANDWDYPIDETLSSSHSQSNKSQNPSPRHDHDDPNTMTFDEDYDDEDDDDQKNDDNHPSNMKYRDRPISPLSAEANLSSEETSASTSSGPIRVSHQNGTRNSMEDEISDSDTISQIQEDQDEDTEVIYDDDAKTVEEFEGDDDLEEMHGVGAMEEAISISLSDGDEDSMDNLEIMGEAENEPMTRNRNRMSQEDQEMRLIVMELKVTDLNEKVLKLMERIRELTDKNNYLELSKMELIMNTSNAMNQYRDTIKKLNQQNMRLMKQIKYG